VAAFVTLFVLLFNKGTGTNGLYS